MGEILKELAEQDAKDNNEAMVRIRKWIEEA